MISDLSFKVFKQLVKSTLLSLPEWLNEASGIKLVNNEALSALCFQHSLAQIYAGHLAHSLQNSFHLFIDKKLF